MRLRAALDNYATENEQGRSRRGNEADSAFRFGICSRTADWPRGFGLRRQSKAATALSGGEKPLEMTDNGRAYESGVRLLTSAATHEARRRRAAAFTLVEVLAALLFMAIVIPVAVEALHVASTAGEVGVRKAAAVRVADAVLNENIVTTNWSQSSSGSQIEDGNEYRWTLRNQVWPADSTMELLTAEVAFTAGGKPCSVRLNTLVSPPTLGSVSSGLP